MKAVLLYANNDSGFECRFQSALAVARVFGSHITCVQVTPYDAFIMADPFGGVYALPTVLEQVRGNEDKHRVNIEERLRMEGVTWDWGRYDGAPAGTIASRARLSDLIILSLAQNGQNPDQSSIVAGVALHARAPVLAIPQSGAPIDCLGSALVAWNGAAEASHALRFALPMLARVSAVHIVTVTEPNEDFPATDASLYLDRHGIRSELHEWPRDGRSTAEALMDAAAVLRAGFITMGAYGHSRMAEAVLGGATREMLRSSVLPLLLAH